MEIPDYQPFYIKSVEALRAEIARLGLDIPAQEDLSPLALSLTIGGQTIPNRLCAQPISGNDARVDGAPSLLTRRRYQRYAAGSFGLIWIERTSTDGGTSSRGLKLTKATVSEFSSMLEEIRASAPSQPFVVLQLTAEEPSDLVTAAHLARDSGFDGVDIQCRRDSMPRTLERVKAAVPDLILATRLTAYEAVREGFGASSSDYRKCDMAAPLDYVRRLVDGGLQMLNVTSSSPRLLGVERGTQAIPDYQSPQEHPLMTIARQLDLARAFRFHFPKLTVIGSGLSWLRQFIPEVTSGALNSGWMDLAGLGRSALACPDLPARVLHRRNLEASVTCMMCHACSQSSDGNGEVGCVIRDADVYGPVFQNIRRFDTDRLRAGAARCHLCEAAPCREKSPTQTDIPSFIKAFRENRFEEAYSVVRSHNVLPELVSQTSPSWLEEEGACIERTLTGTAVPINDLQYAIAWQARERQDTGVRIPSQRSDKTVAIVGGGPTGIAAAARLAELGHRVHILEASQQLGGVPSRILAKTRSIADPSEEITALLSPGFEADRISVSFCKNLGSNIFIEPLLRDYDAVLVAVGLWKERSLGAAEGVVSALDLLEFGVPNVPRRVAVLAGGDSAMDACAILHQAGAAEIYVIFEGPRSEMHWHMPESWFAKQGVHAMTSWRPLSYEVGKTGRLAGIRLRHMISGVEVTHHVDLVVEAMGLNVSHDVSSELATVSSPRLYTAGAMTNGGASVGHCVAEGLHIAETIHNAFVT